MDDEDRPPRIRPQGGKRLRGAIRTFGPFAAGAAMATPIVLFFAMAVGKLPSFLAVTTVATGLVPLLAMLFTATTADVSVDEGGVRYKRVLKRGYIPFVRLRDATIEPSATRSGTLRLDTAEGGAIRLRLAEGHDANLFPAILARMSRKKSPEETPTALLPLARAGRELSKWLAEARAACEVGGANAYRAAAPDAEAIESAFRDEGIDPEIRAAAAHVLLAGATPERAARLAFTIGPNAPPIVVAAAALATPPLIDPTLVEAALPYLSTADRKAFERAAPRVRVEPNQPHVRIATDNPPTPAEPEEAPPSEPRARQHL